MSATGKPIQLAWRKTSFAGSQPHAFVIVDFDEVARRMVVARKTVCGIAMNGQLQAPKDGDRVCQVCVRRIAAGTQAPPAAEAAPSLPDLEGLARREAQP